eukprot:m.13785 g.13785  ORF g.13785 m.13785 type:complete len:1275 (+) comp25228_c0_seq1:253-4077(+)
MPESRSEGHLLPTATYTSSNLKEQPLSSSSFGSCDLPSPSPSPSTPRRTYPPKRTSSNQSVTAASDSGISESAPSPCLWDSRSSSPRSGRNFDPFRYSNASLAESTGSASSGGEPGGGLDAFVPGRLGSRVVDIRKRQLARKLSELSLVSATDIDDYVEGYRRIDDEDEESFGVAVSPSLIGTSFTMTRSPGWFDGDNAAATAISPVPLRRKSIIRKAKVTKMPVKKPVLVKMRSAPGSMTRSFSMESATVSVKSYDSTNADVEQVDDVFTAPYTLEQEQESLRRISASSQESEIIEPESESSQRRSRLLSLKRLLSSGSSGGSQTQWHERHFVIRDELAIIVTTPAMVCRGRKGRGRRVKGHFSPYTTVSDVIKMILERCSDYLVPDADVGGLKLCAFDEDTETWQWLENGKSLYEQKVPNEGSFELKPPMPEFRYARVALPQVESLITMEYDQFTRTESVLAEVLALHEHEMDTRQGEFALFHTRLNTKMMITDSMTTYEILPQDMLECKLVGGRLAPVTLTVSVPALQSFRKIRMTLDETVGDLVSTVQRRLPDPTNSQWHHFALYLHPRIGGSGMGMWLEDYKFLSSYKLNEKDYIEFREKYKTFSFELCVFPMVCGRPWRSLSISSEDANKVFTAFKSIQLEVAEFATVQDVISSIKQTNCLDYPSYYYGLYHYNGQRLSGEDLLWQCVAADKVQSTSFVVRMVPTKVKVCMNHDPKETLERVPLDLSQPGWLVKELLCRRYGVRFPEKCAIQAEGIGTIDCSSCLLQQGVVEQTTLRLFVAHNKRQRIMSRQKERMSTMEMSSLDQSSPTVERKSPMERKISAKGLKRNCPFRRSFMEHDDGENFWDEGPDCRTNIQFSTSRGPDGSPTHTVASATFNKLIQQLTHSDHHDLDFVHTFLLSYQTFTTPENLLAKLIQRYHIVRPTDMSYSDFGNMRTSIQARVINALRLWVEHVDDFKGNSNLQTRLLNFISSVLYNDWPKLCCRLRRNLIAIQDEEKEQKSVWSLKPKPRLRLPAHVSHVMSLFNFHAEEIARQITLIDFKMFSAIKPSELLNQSWCRPKYKHKAQNLLKLIARVNCITKWVATAILSQNTARDRARRMILFIELAHYLYKLHNFNTMVAVIGGLYHSSVDRLRHTKAKLEKMDKKATKKLASMRAFINPVDNFKQLRYDLGHVDPPCIPYLGIFMADLTMIDHGNKNFTNEGLINFSKCRLIYRQVRSFKTYQRQAYNFEQIPALVSALTNFHHLDDDALSEVSLREEPREKPKVK